MKYQSIFHHNSLLLKLLHPLTRIFDLLSMNNRFEVEKSEPGTTFENTLNEIKDNHLKSISSYSMNLSAINYFDEKTDLIIINNSFEAANYGT